MVTPPALRYVPAPHEGSELWPLNAWRDLGITLEVINTVKRYVVFSNGVVMPIIALWDEYGFPVEEWEDCWRYDFGDPRFGYGRADAHSDPVRMH
jgi:hypothetical protein